MNCRRLPLAALMSVGLAMIIAFNLIAADPPPAPKVSSFASVEDLTGQVKAYIADFETSLSTPEAFDQLKQDQTKRDANTLAVLAVALGLHDQDNPLKSKAPALVKAAQEMAKAKDYTTAKAALANVKAALESGSGSTGELSWNTKVASMGQLMKQVNLINNKLRRDLRRFEQRAEDSARGTATLAVIAQAVLADTHEVKNPADTVKWFEMCAEMRAHAGEMHQAIKKKDQPATLAALDKLTKNCEACHAVFRPDVKP